MPMDPEDVEMTVEILERLQQYILQELYYCQDR